MSRYAVYEIFEDSVPESFVYDGRLAGVLVGIAAENPLGPRWVDYPGAIYHHKEDE